MPERRHERGLIDTSVLIDLDLFDPVSLPAELLISAITLAEITAGPHAASDATERARRQERLQRTEATFEPLPVDADVARAYGRAYAAVSTGGSKIRGRRGFDLLIAATAMAAGLPLYTRNPDDFAELGGLVEVLTVGPMPEPSVGGEGIEPPQPNGGRRRGGDDGRRAASLGRKTAPA